MLGLFYKESRKTNIRENTKIKINILNYPNYPARANGVTTVPVFRCHNLYQVSLTLTSLFRKLKIRNEKNSNVPRNYVLEVNYSQASKGKKGISSGHDLGMLFPSRSSLC